MLTTKQAEAHLRLLSSLPVTTHRRAEEKPVNPYTGKPIERAKQAQAFTRGRTVSVNGGPAYQESRATKAGGRVNTWCPINGAKAK